MMLFCIPCFIRIFLDFNNTTDLISYINTLIIVIRFILIFFMFLILQIFVELLGVIFQLLRLSKGEFQYSNKIPSSQPL